MPGTLCITHSPGHDTTHWAHRASHTCPGADAAATQLHRVDGSLATNYRAIFSSVGGGSPANKVLALPVVITTVMR